MKCIPSLAPCPRFPQHLVLISDSRIFISLYFNYLLCRPISFHEPLWLLRFVSAGLGHGEHLCPFLLERRYVVGRASGHPGAFVAALYMAPVRISPSSCVGLGSAPLWLLTPSVLGSEPLRLPNLCSHCLMLASLSSSWVRLREILEILDEVTSRTVCPLSLTQIPAWAQLLFSPRVCHPCLSRALALCPQSSSWPPCTHYL